MRLSLFTGLLLVLFACLTPAPAAAQQSRCADCHFANPSAPGARHLADWDRSPHGRRQIGCERCHGGNATTFESMQAHRDMLRATNPRSPVNRNNLPQTCGVCHAGPYTQFQKSRHFELLKAANTNGPTCSTCHGEVGADLPSPRALETQCQRCHGEKGAQPRPGRAAAARRMIEGVRDVRTQLREADASIARVKDAARRERLKMVSDQVRVPLVQAADSGHAFVFDQLEERLGTARTRLATLQDQLANPAR